MELLTRLVCWLVERLQRYPAAPDDLPLPRKVDPRAAATRRKIDKEEDDKSRIP